MWEIFSGISRDQVLGKLASASIPGIKNVLQERLEVYGKVAKTGESRYVEAFSQITNKWHAVNVFSTARGFFALTISDITPAKESERLLKQSQEIAHLGSWELDLTKNKLIWSDEVYRIFGLEPQEFGASYDAFLDHVHPDDRAAVDAAYSGSIRNGSDSYEIEHRVIRKNASEIRWVHEKCFHIRDSGGNIIRSVGMVLDITERKLYEDVLRATNERLTHTAEDLARSNRDLEQFAYVASHDLQEPLRMVSSFSGLLRENYLGKLDEKADRYLSIAIEGAQRMEALVSDLLTYSRVAGQTKELPTLSVQEALGLALTNLQSAIHETGAKITQDSMPIIPADHVHLTQVFQNLVGNAIKFRRPEVVPKIHIGAVKVPGPQDVPFWRFSVSDNGIGIDHRYSQKVFLLFQRLHKAGKYPGTGVGLALCKKIVERHGGRIWFESELGKGSTFFFTIPSTPEVPRQDQILN